MSSNRKRGRPAHEFSESIAKQVRLLSGYGLIDDEIAAVIGVSTPTLRKYYFEHVASGAPELTAKVAQSLYQMATHPEKPNVTAAIFWLKCRAGWDDQSTKDKPGKKEIQQIQALRADVGSPWEGLMQ